MSVILAKAPMRITMGGGGTDLPSFAELHGGVSVCAAIDKYAYVMLKESFNGKWRLRYSETEEVDAISDIQHPIIRETVARYWKGAPLEIAVMADVPAGTGLGSSGAFGVALQAALARASRVRIDPSDTAAAASWVEMEVLSEPCGPQDTYAAAHGGVCAYRFNSEDVVVNPIYFDPETFRDLEDGLLLFYMGQTRASSAFLEKQERLTLRGDSWMIDNLDRAVDQGEIAWRRLGQGQIWDWGSTLEAQWDLKEERAQGTIDYESPERLAYDRARATGVVLGGKLIGAGGTGYLMVCTTNPDEVREAMKTVATELPFAFSLDGVTVREV